MILRYFFLVLGCWWSGLGAQVPEYHRDIAPIIKRSCLPCHSGHDIGPIALADYKKVATYGQMIRYVTRERLMPPFRAVAPSGHFAGEQRLTEEEINTISEWVKAGTPEGAPIHQALGIPKVFSTEPSADLTLSMAEAFEQYGVYYDQYRVFVLPTGLTEDKWVSGIDFSPGNRSIVKGVMISVDTSNLHRALDEWDPQYGYFSFGELGFVPYESRWYTWSGGSERNNIPFTGPRWLPKHSRLLMHVHYGPTGVPQKDSSSIILRWAEEEVEYPVRTAPLVNPYVLTNDTFLIEANEVQRMHAKFEVPYDMEITELFPHAHFLGRKFEVFAVFPDGKTTELLLRIEDWDFHFKRGYTLISPIVLPRGTVVHTLATYDNTAQNLANPNDPPRTMHWGKRMYEEMLLVYFSFRPVRGGKIFQPGAINVTIPSGKLALNIHQQGRYQLEVTDFSGTALRTVFADVLKSGVNRVRYDLAGLPYGNYVFRLTNSAGGVVDEQVFLFLASDLFE